MRKETYRKMTQPFRDHPALARALVWGNRILTLSIFLGYPAILVILWLQKAPELWRTVGIPLAGFLVVSGFRRVVNRKRPYETFEMAPIIDKDTKGKSFPSRHVFSAMIIALTVTALPGWERIGAVMIVFALIIGLLRVLSGVHYPSDVAAGILAAAAISELAKWISS